jgi:hypothetical protein
MEHGPDFARFGHGGREHRGDHDGRISLAPTIAMTGSFMHLPQFSGIVYHDDVPSFGSGLWGS